ncbi:MAG: TIGR04255 family protein, partial [Pseudanabaena sp.]
TIQPNQTGSGSEQALIVDIDVFTNEVSSIQEDLNKQLAEMRWLKNKIFFSNITDTALNNFGS